MGDGRDRGTCCGVLILANSAHNCQVMKEPETPETPEPAQAQEEKVWNGLLFCPSLVV